jgi:hypothetical protein
MRGGKPIRLVEHKMQQLRRFNLLAPSKNISELDCFITHGRTLTLSIYSIIFLKYKFNNKEDNSPLLLKVNLVGS